MPYSVERLRDIAEYNAWELVIIKTPTDIVINVDQLKDRWMLWKKAGMILI